MTWGWVNYEFSFWDEPSLYYSLASYSFKKFVFNNIFLLFVQKQTFALFVSEQIILTVFILEILVKWNNGFKMFWRVRFLSFVFLLFHLLLFVMQHRMYKWINTIYAEPKTKLQRLQSWWNIVGFVITLTLIVGNRITSNPTAQIICKWAIIYNLYRINLILGIYSVSMLIIEKCAHLLKVTFKLVF